VNRYRWVVLAVGSAAQAATASILLGLAPLAPLVRTEYDLALPQLGIVLASATVGLGLALLAWGALADRIGERPVIATGLLGAALALLGAAAAPSFAWLVPALLAAGALGASANAASGRAVLSWFGSDERGMALGIRQASLPIGGALAAVTLPPLAAATSVRGAFLALAAACAVAALTTLRWLRDPPDRADAAVAAPGDVARPLRDRRILRLAGGTTLLTFPQIGLVAFSVVYLHDEAGWSTGAAALALVGLHLLGATARIVVGRWSDRRGDRLAPLRRIALVSSVLLGALALAALAPGAGSSVALLVAGVVIASWNGLAYAATAELSGLAHSGAAFGVQNTALAVGAAAGPATVGVLVGLSSWPIAFALLALSPLVAFRVLAPLAADERRTRRAREGRTLGRPATVAPAAGTGTLS
jgi:sugar phosphate permease